jgi:hypothetical protein
MFQQMDNDMKTKRQEIQKGRMLAKAIIRRPNGTCEALVVYEGSMPNDFYFSYRLRSPRSPRRTWKYLAALIRYGAAKDFPTRVAQHAIGSTIVSVKIYHAKKLAELMTKSDLAFYGPRQELQPWQVERLRAKESSKLHGARAYSWRGR